MKKIILIVLMISIQSYAKDFNFINLIKDKELILFDQSENNIFQKIYTEYSQNYQEIAKKRAGSIISSEGLSVNSGLNNVGISFENKFSTFSLNFKRDIAPDLFTEDRYLITDQLKIVVSASHLIGELRENGAIDISDDQLNMFAGINFIRTYKISHFANSYKEALYKDFKKLFFPFQYFKANRLHTIEPENLLEKEDSLTFSVGASGSQTLVYGLAVGVGGYISGNILSNVSILNSNIEDDLVISYKKEKKIISELQLKLQADFLKILKMTLFSYDFSYQLSDSTQINIKLNKILVNNLTDNSNLKDNIQKILTMKKPDLESIREYIISSDERIKKMSSSKYSFLVFNGSRENETEEVTLTKDGHVETFFKHLFKKTRNKKGLFSLLVSDILKNIIGLGSFVNDDYYENKNLSFEYRSEENLISKKKDLSLYEDNNDLSINFIHDVFIKKSKNNKYRRYMASYLEHYSSVDNKVVDIVKNGLTENASLYSNLKIKEAGVFYLNNLDVDTVYDIFDDLCSFRPKDRFYRNRSIFGFCKRSIQKSYQKYILERNFKKLSSKDYRSCKRKIKFAWSKRKKRNILKSCILMTNQKEIKDQEYLIPLWRLKDLLNKIHIHSRFKKDIYDLFGYDNVYFKGRFLGTSKGETYQSVFDEGRFQGRSPTSSFLGIENYSFLPFN